MGIHCFYFGFRNTCCIQRDILHYYRKTSNISSILESIKIVDNQM